MSRQGFGDITECLFCCLRNPANLTFFEGYVRKGKTMGEGLVGLVPLIIVLLIGWWIYKSRKNETIVTDEDGNEVRSGLGGWLILVGIGVVLTPIRLLGELGQIYGPFFSDGLYEVLTTPGTDAYHPLWSTIIWGEVIGNVIILLATIYLIFMFFGKKALFPKLYIWIAVGSGVFFVLDALLVKMVLPEVPFFDPDTVKGLIQGVMTLVIWVPYMMLSKRVKVTFVR